MLLNDLGLKKSPIVIIDDISEMLLGKGGRPSGIIEYLFSTARNLGLEMPYVACSLAVLNRELYLHHGGGHKSWGEMRTNDIFGSGETMIGALKDEKAKINGLVEFPHRANKYGAHARERWNYPNPIIPPIVDQVGRSKALVELKK